MRFLSVFFWLASAASVEAATLSGFVQDRDDGERLPYATVAVEASGAGALSNTAGYYAIKGLLPGPQIISVYYVGYRVFRDTVVVAEGVDLRLDIELQREILELEEVVIIADRLADELRQQASVMALQTESLTRMPAMGEPDLLRSLQLLPGVQTASDFSSGLYVRGGGPDQTRILLDQIPLYNPAHAFGFFSTFNPDAIKDITFYKGAYPARYGGSLGAVLDVQNREGNRRAFSTSGGISLISSRWMLEGPLGEGSWMVAARRTYIDPILAVIQRRTDLDELGYYFFDFNAKVNSQLTPSDDLTVSAYQGRDALDVGVGDGTDNVVGLKWGNRAVTGRWTHVFSPALFGRWLATFSEYRSDIFVKVFDTPIAVRNRVRDMTLKVDLDYFASTTHTIGGGGDLTFFDFDYGTEFNHESTNLGVRPYLLSAYLQDDWKITPLTEARIGLRAGYYEDGSRFSLNPRFSLSHLLQDGWRCKLAGGRYHQYLQLVSTEGFSGADVWVPLDETVPPGQSHQLVWGLEWEPAPDYRLSTEAYYTDLENLVLIDENVEVDRWTTTSEEVFKTGGTGYATGVEFFGEKTRGRLTGWLGYTYGWTRRRFPEVDQGRSFPPKYDRRHDVSVTTTYRFDRWSLTANFVYGTGQAFTPASARYTLRNPSTGLPVDRVLAARRNTARLLPYHRLDLGLRRRVGFLGSDAEGYLQIFNIYNRRNEWFVQYDPEDSNKSAQVIRMLPIVPTVGFNFTF